MEVRMLGRPAVIDGDARHTPRPGKTSAVLYLAAYRADWIDREELLAMFWPESDEKRARANLRQLLSVVRRQPLTALPEIENTRIRWRVPSDVTVFRDSVGRDEVAAAEIYRGPLLDGFRVPEAPAFEEWLGRERDALHRIFRLCALQVGSAMAAGGRPMAAAQLFARALQHDPLDEELVRKRMLALQAAHGASEALAYHADVAAMLEDEVGIAPEPATTELARSMRVGELSSAVNAAASSREPRASPLPRPATRFVGRVRELAHICNELTSPGVRFLNLTGPGGIGKTRLAIEAAACVEDAFPGGVAFIPLVQATRADEIHARVAAALAVPLEAELSALEAIAASDPASPRLLVLDNLEQIEGAAGPLGDLLRVLPFVTILGTSRAVLGVEGEVVRALEGLDVPEIGTDHAGGVAHPGRSDAVQLFLEAGARMLPTFDPDESELEGIVRVCRATGGMPLAIEFAAQWVRVLRVSDIAAEIERDLDHLTRRSHASDARHESMRSVFDRSWARLTDVQRHALVAMSVFRGDFTSAHARHVAGVDNEVLLELLDRSFLQARGAGRIGQHPLVRAYVRERREQHPQIVERARHAHAELYASLIAEWSDHVFGAGDGDAVRKIGAEIEDAHAAWRFAVEARRWDWIQAMLPAMNRYHDTRNIRGAFIELVQDALRVVASTESTWQLLVQVLVYHLVGDGRYEQAIAEADDAMEALRAQGDPWRRAAVLCWVGVAHAKLARGEVAARIWHEALAVPGIGAEPRIEGRILANLSFVTLDATEADRLFEKGVCKAREDGSALDLNWMLRNQSIHVLRTYGRYREAETIAAEAVERVRDFSEGNVVTALQNLAYVHMRGGRLSEAEKTLHEADELVPRLGDPRRRIARVEQAHLKAHLLADRGSPEAALALCRETLSESQNNVHRLLLARLHLETGGVDEAAALAARLARSADDQDGVRGRHYMTIMAELLVADVTRMQGVMSEARSGIARALERAAEHTFLPVVSHGLLLAAYMVTGSSRRRFLEVAHLHPTSSHETRMRAKRSVEESEPSNRENKRDVADLLEVAREAVASLRP